MNEHVISISNIVHGRPGDPFLEVCCPIRLLLLSVDVCRVLRRIDFWYLLTDLSVEIPIILLEVQLPSVR